MYDHIGLKVKDLAASVRFYEETLKSLGHVLCSRDEGSPGWAPKASPRCGSTPQARALPARACMSPSAPETAPRSTASIAPA